MNTTENDIQKQMILVQQIVAPLTPEQQQLLKDTIIYGVWGDGTENFLNENNEKESSGMMGYCTNDAKKAGHFNGRKISAMFRAMFRKLCPEHHNQIGRYISHCNDWWGDGSGDMLFIRSSISDAFEAWARQA